MPESIGHYEVDRVLGSGAFATVWLAHDERLDAPGGDQGARRELGTRRRRPANVSPRRRGCSGVVDSDRAIRVQLVDELDDGRPYFVMDYADRGSLADRMAERASDGTQYSIDEALADRHRDRRRRSRSSTASASCTAT